MRLYNAWYCPFAQRVWMALVHKGIDFEYVEVDPYQKSEWWSQISRGAELVPVLVESGSEGENTIIESSRILEFLQDYLPQTQPIYSDDPLRRAEQKYWMDQIGSQITTHLYQFLKASVAGEKRDQAREKMLLGLRAITAAMDAEGPFFSGDSIDAVDIALMPFAYRIDVLLKAYRDFSLPESGEIWRRYRRWYDAMLAQPSFTATAFAQPDYEQRLVVHYYPYSLGDGHRNAGQSV